MSVLRQGSRGPAVSALQQALNSKLIPSPNLGVDGVFGANTKAAVVKFQQQARIGVDGAAGPQTQAALANAGSAPRPPVGGGNVLREGSRGPNVAQLQQALNAKLHPSPGLNPDGVFGGKTKAAVIRFQQQAGLAVDGVAGPQTQAALASAKTPSPGTDNPEQSPGGTVPPVSSNKEYFPFATLTSWSWTSGMRAFAANRSSGKRAHAGCDLYYPQGTKIYAIKDGTVVRGPYSFYLGTYALEVDHGTFLARYGEIQSGSPVGVGDKIVAGQHIAQVGHLVGINVPSDMLHFEMYSGTGSGGLTVPAGSGKKRSDGIPFNRRSDLLDPTSYLNTWKNNLPPG